MRIVNLFSGAVNFDANGKADIELALPGFDGSLRLMAVAAWRERMGSAERDESRFPCGSKYVRSAFLGRW